MVEALLCFFAQNFHIFFNRSGRMFIHECFRCVRCFTDNSKNCSLYRTHDCFICHLCAVFHYGTEIVCAKVTQLLDCLIESAENLRCDNTRVTARTHKQTAAQSFCDNRKFFTAGFENLADAVGKCQRHVCAGISVRYRKHVQCIDFLFAVVQVVTAAFQHFLQLFTVHTFHDCHLLTQ